MLFDFILQIVILFSLAGIIFILARKIPQIKKEELSQNKSNFFEINDFFLFKKKIHFFKRIKDFLKKFFLEIKKTFLEIKKKFLLVFALTKEEYLKEKEKYRKIILKNKKKEYLLDSNLIEQAKQLLEKKSSLEAEDLLVKAIQINSKNLEAYRLIGGIYFEQKNFRDAKEAFTQILKIDPQNKEAQERLSQIFGLEKEISSTLNDALKNQ